MADQKKTIVFVCAKNAARSPMAEAFFKKYNQRTDYKAISAGTNPKDTVNEEAVRAMQEKEIDISTHHPQLLTEAMIRNAHRIVTLCSESCPVTPEEKTEHWDLEDPCGKGMEKFREIRDVIEQKVKELIGRIQ